MIAAVIPKNVIIFDNPASKNAQTIAALLQEHEYTVEYGGMRSIIAAAQKKTIFGTPEDVLVCAPNHKDFAIADKRVEDLIKYQRAERVLPMVLYPSDAPQPQEIGEQSLADCKNVHKTPDLEEGNLLHAIHDAKGEAERMTQRLKPAHPSNQKL